MKKLLFAVILTMVAALGQAKDVSKSDTISIRRAFVDLPVNVLDLLNRTTRLDMLDYYDVDSIYSAPNTMEGISRLDTVAPDYLKLQLTDVSTLAIKLLKDKKGRDIVMTLYTIGGQGQAPDTEVCFFDASLQELQKDKYFKLPQLSDFFSIPKGSATTMKEIKEMVPFPTMEYFAYSGSDVVDVKLTIEAYVDQDDYNIMKLFLLPTVAYRWDGSRFKKISE